MHIYGIKNCDTVKKALTYLNEKNIAYTFHDFKKQPPSKTLLLTWLKHVDWKILLNQRGLTWRRLPEEIRQTTTTKTKAIELMLQNPSIIKRPVLENNGQVIIGFDQQLYSEL